MTRLYHVTSADKLDSIRENGLAPGCYLTDSLDIAAYYQDGVEDEDGAPVVLEVALEDLDAGHLSPDNPSLQEPITRALGMTEDEVFEAWGRSGQSWRDSLEIVRSVRYGQPVAAALIVFPGGPGPVPAP